MTTMSEAAVTAALAELEGWTRDGDAIRTSVELASFPDAVAFVTRVGFLAEAADHHPDLDVRWRTVHVSLTSHDVGGITERDVALARAIEGLGVR